MFASGTQNLSAPGHAATIRQPATAQLLIDSWDRFKSGYPVTSAEAENNSSSNWRLNLQQIVLNGYVNRMGVSQIQLHWNLPTIITNYNDVFEITYDGTSSEVTLGQAFYTVTELAAELQSQINSATGGAFTVTWDAAAGTFKLDAGAGHTCFITPNNDYRRCLHTLGFIAGTPADREYYGIPPTMLATRYIDICSTYLTKYQRLKDANSLPSNITSTCIARVYGTSLNSVSKYTNAFNEGTTDLPASNPGDSPFIITVDYTFPKQIGWNPTEGISNFDIQLRDEEGELVPYVSPGYAYVPGGNTSLPGAPGIMVEYSIVLLCSED